MGHEIAHAVAKHSVERMSAAMAVNVTTQIADIFTKGAISQTRNTVGRATGIYIYTSIKSNSSKINHNLLSCFFVTLFSKKSIKF